MKYCYQCGHMTEGDPQFCNSCGRSYDVKLCPRLHQNPRGAEVCSQCGSRELSTPQPKIPLSWKLLALVVKLGLGLLLFYASLKLLIALILTPQFQQLLVLIGVMLSGLWWLYSRLPDWLQEALRSLWKRKENHDD
jgi:RNA polymerase subunit RPABC4/transcription elongation factor Spt4